MSGNSSDKSSSGPPGNSFSKEAPENTNSKNKASDTDGPSGSKQVKIDETSFVDLANKVGVDKTANLCDYVSGKKS